MAFIDWLIIGIFLAGFLIIGLSFRKRGSESVEQYYLGGRKLPWYIAGLSMVATTFAADTPLAVTELVAQSGISGNWLWWNGLAGGMLTVIFFSHLWRKSGVLTEVEFIELRYSGKPAAFLRGLKAIYLGLFMNVLIIGWVNVAFLSIMEGMFDIPVSQGIYIAAAVMFLAFIVTSMSGLLGVAYTDVVQFVLAMVGCIVLAVLVVNSDEIGGLSGLVEKLPASTFEFFPSVGDSKVAGTMRIGLGSFIAFFGIVWWASWYPGAEPGGGGYVAQRAMSTRSEKEAIQSTLLFQIAHYAIRPWPWIIVALCALVLYPELNDSGSQKMGFIYAMRDFLPAGFKGLLVMTFIAAYMSTISTQLNWGASYLTNDLYMRFINKNASQKNLIRASRIITGTLMILGLILSLFIDNISNVWKFIMECGAGLGLVLILRWYWYRISAWSEIAATIAPFFFYGLCRYIGIEFPDSLFVTVFGTTVVWLLVTYLFPNRDAGKIAAFEKQVQPKGFWPSANNPKGYFATLFTGWIFGVLSVYSVLFAVGKFLFSSVSQGLIWTLVAVVSIFILVKMLHRINVYIDE